MDKTDISKFKIVEGDKESTLEEKDFEEALKIKPEDKYWHIKITDNRNSEVLVDENTPAILGVVLTDKGSKSLTLTHITGALSIAAIASLIKTLDEVKKSNPIIYTFAEMFYKTGGIYD